MCNALESTIANVATVRRAVFVFEFHPQQS
jgi:hypothetical protein